MNPTSLPAPRPQLVGDKSGVGRFVEQANTNKIIIVLIVKESVLFTFIIIE